LKIASCKLQISKGRFPWIWELSRVVFFLLIGLWAGCAHGQNFLETKNFRVAEPYDPPHETQTKSLLEGAKARRLPDGKWFITDATLHTFRVTGEQDLVAKAPECLYSPVTHTANSDGPLHAQMADGSFSIEGKGFEAQQTNSTLRISNQVHTVVQPKMIGPEAKKTETPDAQLAGEGMEIFSRSFDYTNGVGVATYRDNVHVVGTNLDMTSRVLTVELPSEERKVKNIIAEQQVVINYTNENSIHATGERAVYATDKGLITLTGHPTWRVDQREGRGDELVIDRTNRIFQANGNAWLRSPSQSSGTFSFLSTSNSVATTKAQSTNEVIEVRSRAYEFRTNSAFFQDDVRLSDFLEGQLRGTITCGRLTAHSSGSNELHYMLAENNVVIQSATNRLTGGRAVYTGTNGWLDLTEEPAWSSGNRNGRGRLVRVVTQTDAMRVLGDAYLRLPAGELGDPQAFAAQPAPRKSAAKPGVTNFAEITCENYTLQSETAQFEGKVHVSHPQMNWVSDRMKVQSLPEGGKRLDAEGKVIFDLLDDRGQTVHGVGDTVVYTNTVTDAITNDIIYLRGKPAMLETTNLIAHNDLITLDRARNVMTAPGAQYKIKGKTQQEAKTNSFKLQKGGIKK
jgi:lipopolysaccharide export system protein LptA